MNSKRYVGPGWSEDSISVFEKIIEAHGGWRSWDNFDEVRLTFESFTGVVPNWKKYDLNAHKPDFLRILPKEKYLSLHYPEHVDIFEKGKVTTGEDKLVVEDGAALLSGKTHEKWTAAQFTYFVGYAMTSYMGYPFNLTTQELVSFKKVRKGYCFKIRFSKDFHNHCRVQKFYFNDSYVLEKFYYWAYRISPFAIGAHFPKDYVVYKGLKLGLTRHVLGRFLFIVYPLKAILAVFKLKGDD